MPSSSSLWRTIAIISLIYLLFLQLTTKSGPDPRTLASAPNPESLHPNISTTIPKKIWQTWHTPSISLNDSDKDRILSWYLHNPDYRYELLTDSAAESFVKEHYGSGELKWIGDVFLGLTDKILKADFLRYLLLYASGGVRLPHCLPTQARF